MTLDFHTRSIALRRAALAPTLLLLVLTDACVSIAQQAGPSPNATLSGAQERIRTQLTALNAREMAKASNRELGYRWTVLGYEYSNAGEFPNSENAYNHALELLGKDPADASLQADALDQLGALYRIYGRIPESLSCRRKSLELRQKLGDPRLIALSQSHLAEAALVAHQYKEAFQGADEAVRALAATDGHDDLYRITALITRAYAQCGLHRHAECLADARQAMAMSRGGFPEDSPEVAGAQMALSVAQLQNGQAAEALDSARQALNTLRAALSAEDPRVVFALSQDRDCLVALHRKQEAREVEAQLAAIDRQSKENCAHCTVSVFGLMPPKAF